MTDMSDVTDGDDACARLLADTPDKLGECMRGVVHVVGNLYPYVCHVHQH